MHDRITLGAPMPFSGGFYPADVLKLMRDVLAAAFGTDDGLERQVTRMVMASRIMAGVDAGERDPKDLKRAASVSPRRAAAHD
jgi:hypothetical protein